MKQYLTQPQKSFKDSYINLQKFIPTKSILERRTFGNLKPFPSLKHVRDAYARASNQTGKNITGRRMKYASLWKKTAKTNSKERFKTL